VGRSGAMRIVDMNKAMKKLYSPDWDLGSVRLPRGLNTLTEGGVVLHDGCYVLKESLEANPHILLDQYPDRTSYESFLNHVHIRDNGGSRLPVAFAYLQRISDVLARQFPDEQFVGIISSTRKGRDCVVRFYAKHQGERNWLSDDLEGYKTEAVCLLDLPGDQEAKAGRKLS
jgi:hypothetical protein